MEIHGQRWRVRSGKTDRERERERERERVRDREREMCGGWRALLPVLRIEQHISANNYVGTGRSLAQITVLSHFEKFN